MLDALSKNLAETFSRIIQSFRIAAFFPALCFVLLHDMLILPYLSRQGIPLQIRDDNSLLLILLWTALIAYVLRYLNFSIIRILEGYPFLDTEWARLMIRWHKRQKAYMEQQSKILPDSDPKKKMLKDNLHDYYPPCENDCAPTALGNVVAAFETYPHSQYGIDAVYIWPRLLPVLAAEGYAPFVDREKEAFDFFLNITVLSGVFTVECTLLRFHLAHPSLTWLALASACIAYIFYRAAIVNALNWGEMVKTAFDLYRYQLAEALALKTFEDKEKEKKYWENISSSLRKEQEFLEFNYPLPKEKNDNNATHGITQTTTQILWRK
jgi:hypothetical protein